MALHISKLKVAKDSHQIIDNVTFVVESAKVVTLEGQNGSGKTTLVRAVAGDPGLTVTGSIKIDNLKIDGLTPEKRFKAGLFVSFQNPPELPNIKVADFLKDVYFEEKSFENCHEGSLDDFATELSKSLLILNLDEKILAKTMNQDFSGGEKKRLEALQMLLLRPKFALLDEIDSGVDHASLTCIAKVIKYLIEKNHTGFLIITHYQKFKDLLTVDKTLRLSSRPASPSLGGRKSRSTQKGMDPVSSTG